MKFWIFISSIIVVSCRPATTSKAPILLSEPQLQDSRPQKEVVDPQYLEQLKAIQDAIAKLEKAKKNKGSENSSTSVLALPNSEILEDPLFLFYQKIGAVPLQSALSQGTLALNREKMFVGSENPLPLLASHDFDGKLLGSCEKGGKIENIERVSMDSLWVKGNVQSQIVYVWGEYLTLQPLGTGGCHLENLPQEALSKENANQSSSLSSSPSSPSLPTIKLVYSIRSHMVSAHLLREKEQGEFRCQVWLDPVIKEKDILEVKLMSNLNETTVSNIFDWQAQKIIPHTQAKYQCVPGNMSYLCDLSQDTCGQKAGWEVDLSLPHWGEVSLEEDQTSIQGVIYKNMSLLQKEVQCKVMTQVLYESSSQVSFVDQTFKIGSSHESLPFTIKYDQKVNKIVWAKAQCFDTSKKYLFGDLSDFRIGMKLFIR